MVFLKSTLEYIPMKKDIFLMSNLNPFDIYILYLQEKNYIFSMWDLKPFRIYTLCSQKKIMFFQYGI
jgi:uncharacterized membrane protein (UPF0127 family)